MASGILLNTLLRQLFVLVTIMCLTYTLPSYATNPSFDDRILAIDSGKSPPFTLLAIETLVPMKSKEFDSPSLRVMGMYGFDTIKSASQSGIPIVAETPQGLLQTMKSLGTGYAHEASDLSATNLVVDPDQGSADLLSDQDIPPLDSSQIPAGTDEENTQLWQDLNTLAQSTAGSCSNSGHDCCQQNCCNHEKESCTGDSCPAPTDTEDTSCTGDGCSAEQSCSDSSCGDECSDCCDCCCTADVGGGALGSGYFGYGAGGGGSFGGGFGGGGAGASAKSNSKSHNKPPPTPVPEPSTYLIMAGAALVVAALRRRQAGKNEDHSSSRKR